MITELTRERLAEKVSYDPETGTFTKKTKRGRVGFLSKGRLWVCVDYVTYPATHLAWLWVYGQLPTGIVDHENGDPLDNRINNLRVATPALNAQNRRRANAGKSSGLPLGVYPSGRRFYSTICISGVKTHLGVFSTPEEAYEKYLAFRRKNCPGNTL